MADDFINKWATIISGETIGGISLFEDALQLRKQLLTERISGNNHFAFRATFDWDIEIVSEKHHITILVDFFSRKLKKLSALNGYKGKWKDRFSPGEFTLSDLLAFDWTFEHMERGLLLSENHKGIGFVVPEKYDQYSYHFLEAVYPVGYMLDKIDFLIEEIVVFPEQVGNLRIWDVYEPFIWEESLKKARLEEANRHGFVTNPK